MPTDKREVGETQPIVTGSLSSQPLYHGSRADLKPGDLLGPAYTSNFG